MQEITKLNVTRQQFAEKHFYYNGCETAEIREDTAKNEILNLVADVLINILISESEEK